jgi:hypothetical protein
MDQPYDVIAKGAHMLCGSGLYPSGFVINLDLCDTLKYE